jgi:hypothetical protein
MFATGAADGEAGAALVRKTIRSIVGQPYSHATVEMGHEIALGLELYAPPNLNASRGPWCRSKGRRSELGVETGAEYLTPSP